MAEQEANASCLTASYSSFCFGLLANQGQIGSTFQSNYYFPVRFATQNPSALRVDARIDPSSHIQLITVANGLNQVPSVRTVWFQMIAPRSLSRSETINMINAFKNRFILLVDFGIKTFRLDWICELALVTQFNNLPLWDVNPDGNPNQGIFIPYGGWLSPSAKQYTQNAQACGNTFLNSRYIG